MENQHNRRRRNRVSGWLVRLFPLVLSLVLLVVLLQRFQGGDLLLRIDPLLLVLAAAISIFLNVFVGTYKWQKVIELSGLKAGFWELWWPWTGLFAATFLMPFQTGQVLFVIALKKIKGTSYFIAIESIAYDRYLNIVALCTLIVAGQLMIPAESPMSQWWILAASLFVVLIYLFDPLLVRALGRFEFVRARSRLMKQGVAQKRKLLLLVLSVAVQSAELVSACLICRGLEFEVPLWAIIALYPIIIIVSYLPLTFHGFGAREGLIIVMLGGFLVYDQALALGLLVDLLNYILPALFGLIALRRVFGVLTGDLFKKQSRKVENNW